MSRSWVRARVGGALAVAAALLALTGCSADEPSQPVGAGVPPAAAATPAPTAATLARTPRGPTDAGWRVTKVSDGDTLWVSRAGSRLKVRLLGIDTPETVHPDQPVGCYGPEASAFAADELLGRDVVLEYDDSQGRTDRYDRTLAYVWRVDPDGLRMFNLDAVRLGYAQEYLYDEPYAWWPEFVAAQEQARREGLGQWGACPAGSS